jgi:hypothetical protein
MKLFRAAVLAFAVAGAVACGGSPQVRSAPQPQAAGELIVALTNSLSQAVNVYVTPAGGTELFLRQVAANTVERVPVQGVTRGTMVTFKAVTVDASRTYQSRNVPLNGLFPWTVP